MSASSLRKIQQNFEQSSADYQIRKLQELEFLNSFAKKPIPKASENSFQFNEVFASKSELKADLQIQYLMANVAQSESYSVPQGNGNRENVLNTYFEALGKGSRVSEQYMNQQVSKLGRFKYFHSYRRSDGQILFQDALAEVYGISGQRSSMGYFTGSGMAAITSVFLGMKKADWKKPAVYLNNDSYFETIKILKGFFSEIKICFLEKSSELPKEEGYLFYDSGGREKFDQVILKTPLSKVKGLFFDSTCYPIGDQRITEAVQFSEKNRIPLFLIRSHTKLDCIGLEYGRWGSVVCILPKGSDIVNRRLANQIHISAVSSLGSCGLNFEPQFIFPLYHHNQTFELNQKRHHWIVQNCIEFQRKFHILKVENTFLGEVELSSFQHQLFVTLSASEIVEMADWQKIRDQFLEQAQRKNIPVRAAASFALDFNSITVFPKNENGKVTMRISFSDGPTDQVKELVDCLVQALREYGNEN